MLIQENLIPENQVKDIPWEGDHLYYDLQLFKLGEGLDEFWVINPLEGLRDKWFNEIQHYDFVIPTSRKCIVLEFQGQWIVKIFKNGWYPYHGYETVEIIRPNLIWKRNPDLDISMTFEQDIYLKYEPIVWDIYYKLVWYIDTSFCPLDDKVWAFSCEPLEFNHRGIKDMGEVTPEVVVEYNHHLRHVSLEKTSIVIPYWELDNICAFSLNNNRDHWVLKISPAYKKVHKWKWIGSIDLKPIYKFYENISDLIYEVDYVPSPDDLDYELVWFFDHKHTHDNDIIAFSISYIENPIDKKNMGYVSPLYEIEKNPNLPDLEYDLDFIIKYYDFCYDQIWLLDSKFLHHDENDIWAVKLKFTKNSKGEKYRGTVYPEFNIEYNLNLPELNYELDYQPPYYDLSYSHTWFLDRKHLKNNEADIWVFKISYVPKPIGNKNIGYISPITSVIYNQALPELSYEIDYIPSYYDLSYNQTFMLDRKHLKNNEGDIWAFKLIYGNNIRGEKIVGSISPIIEKEYSPFLPKLSYNIDYDIAYHDFEYEHVWMLDHSHTTNSPDPIWAVKWRLLKNTLGNKVMGEVSPKLTIKTNPILDYYKFSVDQYKIPYYDFNFTHVWKLNDELNNGEDIWAISVSAVKKPKGWKVVGQISPITQIEYNPALSHISINLDYKIPYYDRMYQHIWYLNQTDFDGNKIWAVKMYDTMKFVGVKEMGEVVPIMSDHLDVVFISYKEINAEENWLRVLEKAPWAKRVNGVEGIFNAHQEAAKISSTDMFYVVDGDAYLVDNWDFDFNPGVFERDIVHIWTSQNPINNLKYGYGGVKLFPRDKFLNTKTWTNLDLATTVSDKIKIMPRVSNITRFNTDAYSTWRSAFRECVKLMYNINQEPNNDQHVVRLNSWLDSQDGEFAEVARKSASDAVNFATKNIKKLSSLKKINDNKWLEKVYKNYE